MRIGGLPSIWSELQAASYNVSQALKAKVVNVPGDHVFTDAADPSKTYLLKPLEVSEYLLVLPSYSGTLATDAAVALDLAGVPMWQDPHMGSPPSSAELKYTEGKPVSP